MRKRLLSKTDVESIITSMSLDEKVALLRAGSAISTDPISELGIPAICLADGVTGINYGQVFIDELTKRTGFPEKMDDSEAGGAPGNMLSFMEQVLSNPKEVLSSASKDSIQYRVAERLYNMQPGGEPPTCFPSGILYGAAWSEESAYAGGQALGQEMDAFGVDVVLGPNVDIQRDPLGGRAYECYSEDPYLVGRTAASYISGIQSQGVAACAKHFAVNNQETNRSELDTRVSERALREIYLRGFENAVKLGKVKTVMAALNKLNGVTCSENSYLLKSILRNEWGFDGFVVSDWGAAKNKVEALKAGNDLILPGPQDMTDVYKAIEEGVLNVREIDECVKNILRTMATLNCFTGRDKSRYGLEISMKAAYRSVVEGSVLMKNENVLPIKPGTKTVFWGNRTKKLIECGGGSTQVYTTKTSNIFDSALKLNGPQNCYFEEYPKDGEYFVYTVGAPGYEGADIEIMDIESGDREQLADELKKAKARGLKTVVILNIAGPVDMRRWIEFADAILCIFIPGCEGGRATANMLFGVEEPSGRLPLTFPKKYVDTPTWINFPGTNNVVTYGEDIFVGYRYYDKKELEPQFPFGHGLGYTTFEMTPCMESLIFDADTDESLRVPVRIRNTGNRRGAAVTQLYVAQTNPTLVKPVKELKGFKKVYLDIGEEQTVEIPVNKDSFASFDPVLKKWTVEPGKYELLIGFSSRNIAVSISAVVKGANPYKLGKNTPYGEVIKNTAAKAILFDAVPDLSDIEKNPPHILSNRKLHDVLTKAIIVACPDAVRASKIIDGIYKKLESI